jgi:hypothetical protein
MANRNSGHRPGGGIASNKVVNKPVRTGQRAERVHQGGAGQLGIMQGSHGTNQRTDSSYRGDPLLGGPRPAGAPGSVLLGNEVAAKTVCGPRGSRNLYGQSGSQGTHGSVNPGDPRPNPRHDAFKQE